MDLVAEMLLKQLQSDHRAAVQAEGLRPHFVTAFSVLPGLNDYQRFNLNRAATRFVSYPTKLLSQRGQFDLFHVADHSYGHLANFLPASRTGVFCHDLNAFSPLLAPSEHPSPWRTAMAWAQLRGVQRAAIVFYSTEQVRAQLLQHCLIDPEKLVGAPYGVSPEFWTTEGDESELPPACPTERPFLLNVGSSDPRKRLDVLFRVFAAVREQRPDMMLVQQGAELTDSQLRLIADLRISDALIQPPRLSRRALGAIYHRAALVVLPSESEGFGLPVVEALAAGAPVVVSDIPAFREVGREAVLYCQVGDIENWVDTVIRVLDDPEVAPPLSVRQIRAKHFSWERHAEVVLDAYLGLLDSPRKKARDWPCAG
jgi:glycosyltransferase involved in cell wall biosynthesis